MSIKRAMATGMLLDQLKEDSVNHLAQSIAQSFSLLANLEPGVALDVLDQLNDQFNEEIAEELIKSRKEQISRVASMMNITDADLDEMDEE